MYVISNYQVIADFDATLTKYRVDGQRGHSMLYSFLYLGHIPCFHLYLIYQ